MICVATAMFSSYINTMRLWDLEAGGVGEKSDVVDMWFATCVGMSTNWICKRIIQSWGASVNQHQGILQPLLPWWCFNSYYRLQVFSIFSKEKWCTRKRILELKNASNVIKDWSLGCTYDILHTLESVWHMITCGFVYRTRKAKWNIFGKLSIVWESLSMPLFLLGLSRCQCHHLNTNTCFNFFEHLLCIYVQLGVLLYFCLMYVQESGMKWGK